ncbi:hypothetical protein AAZX31_15G147500 [Glycine max]|uniref:Probable purine permease n=3 Tax=Glycine subgen. Soja TaxID=1462606 RepID=I1MGS5_SOYBN|nr:probable purine permease 4 [Glycine max]XP_028203682.1 probable purine permease 4 [Glycine soja]KAG4949224.1 hypothetical protein JHK86_042463 [Glycine max]KAG4956711.1 hypothetical protein JHK85_043091 [Glycine max]KAG5105449.1 hypothetical protein JHK82_042419 [Glycine max]KAH1147332.1 hypothetical protein GYH30_042474 [Glycine max]KAH1209185.1 putative purine permease 4 [Glycine max]|eukprot:XP_003547402.1 probable purine permease 4 [Glycine max]
MDNIEHHHHEDQKSMTNKRYRPLLFLNYVLLFVGSVSSSLLTKYYFNHKGSSKWVSSWVQCAGFPFLVIPIFLPSLLNYTERKPFSDFTPKMLWYSFCVGVMLGFNNLLYSWGVAYLPISTSGILLSFQLAFTLILSAIIVKQKITFSNLNSMILITMSSAILAFNSSHEKSEGLTQKDYIIGFSCTIGASFLFSLYLPLMERIYERVYCYEMVMEMQIIMEIAATALVTGGMVYKGGFSEMREEAERVFDKGSTFYWLTVVSSVVTWQCCYMGTAGLVFLTSSVTGGVSANALLSLNVLAGWFVYHDAFNGFKIVATVLCIWGFCSYVYCMYFKRRQEEAAERRNSSGGSTTELVVK